MLDAVQDDLFVPFYEWSDMFSCTAAQSTLSEQHCREHVIFTWTDVALLFVLRAELKVASTPPRLCAFS